MEGGGDEEGDDEADDGFVSSNSCVRFIADTHSNVYEWFKENSLLLWRTFLVILSVAYAVYFGVAMAHEFGMEVSVRLLWITCLVVFGIAVCFLHSCAGSGLRKRWQSATGRISTSSSVISW